MVHPLLRLIATQPQLLVEHVEAYADLVAEEVGHASGAWKRRTLLQAIALCSLLVAAVLTGVAAMLWAVVAVANMPNPWLLVVVPLLPLVAACGCLAAARKPSDASSFENLRQQLKADIGMLREVGTP